MLTSGIMCVCFCMCVPEKRAYCKGEKGEGRKSKLSV